MKQAISFERLLSRISFVLLLLGLVSAPQLLSENPGPIFSQVRSLLLSISLPIWILIIFIAIAIMWAITNLQKATGAQPRDQSSVEALPISEVVKSHHGGNGLASVAYIPTLKFLRIIGWIAVKDPDKECIVIDGKHVIRQTKLYAAPMLLLGKPINARRILLSPPPLEDIKATALTSDQLNLTLVVSVKYSIIKPAYVASLSAPLTELNNLLTGVIVEQVHTNTLEDIVKDDGTLRSLLKQKLGESPSIKDYFKIDEVLKALPTGDERIIEIIRQTKEALQKQALIEQEGQNRARVADFDLAIKKAETQLKDEFDQKQHDREMEMLHMQQEYEAMRELMRTIAQVAASGVNPGPAIREIRSVLSQAQPKAKPSLPKPVPESSDLISSERGKLEALQEKIGFSSFNIQPFEGSPTQPGCVEVIFPDYTLMIDCTADYPTVAPRVSLLRGQGNPSEITNPMVYWRQPGRCNHNCRHAGAYG
jgi:hypothetical protein